MSRAWAHPTPAGVKAIHAAVIAAHGGADGLRDETMLESGVAAPQATWGGEPLITDGIEIAAAYLFYLCSNHPFVDGNKRTALATCLVFLEENDLITDRAFSAKEIDSWEALVLDVAASGIDRVETTKRLQKLVSAPRR